MRATIQNHVGKELRLVHLTSIGTGNSDPNGNFIFHKVWQVIIGAITRSGLHIEISGLVSPGYSAIDEEQIDLMSFGVGDFRKLKASGCRFSVVLA